MLHILTFIFSYRQIQELKYIFFVFYLYVVKSAFEGTQIKVCTASLV